MTKSTVKPEINIRTEPLARPKQSDLFSAESKTQIDMDNAKSNIIRPFAKKIYKKTNSKLEENEPNRHQT